MSHRTPPCELAGRSRAVTGADIHKVLTLTARPGMISFAGGSPAAELLDTEGIRSAYDEALSRSPRRALQYAPTDGDPDLREAVAERLRRRGLPSRAADVLVTTGASQALTLLATTLLDPGDVVLVEEPTFMGALQAFGYAGARVIPVPTDRDGVVVEALAALAAEHRPRMLYLVPDFQNPTGRTLPVRRRAAAAALAARHGFWIVEDDPYGELRFRGDRVPWISTRDEAADRTVLLGSLSKTLSPGMRLGWMRAPAPLRNACVLAKQAFDLCTSAVDQAAAARYLAAHDLDERLVPVRSAYRQRCDALLAALPEALPHGSTWSVPDGGMFVWARLPEGFDAGDLLARAADRGVAYFPGAPFFAGTPDPRTLRLSFAGNSPAATAEGMRRLAGVFRAPAPPFAAALATPR
ncbi:aminotransferase-like domain-containing protein [Streptomyces humi]